MQSLKKQKSYFNYFLIFKSVKIFSLCAFSVGLPTEVISIHEFPEFSLNETRGFDGANPIVAKFILGIESLLHFKLR